MNKCLVTGIRLGYCNRPNINLTNVLNRSNNAPLVLVPYRSTMILKRRFPVDLNKEGNKPRIKKRSQFYNLVKNTDMEPDPIMNVVLTSYVQGLGNEGDIISMKRSAAYHKLLLPGLADYPTKENLEYANNLKKDTVKQEKQISPTLERCIGRLGKKTVSIVMNKETEWTLEPWHVRASFRKGGIHILSDKCIELPAQPIKGPDLSLENKLFDVIITINNKHKVKVRCRIHHWSTNISDRLPYVEEYWKNPEEKVFPDPTETETSTK